MSLSWSGERSLIVSKDTNVAVAYVSNEKTCWKSFIDCKMHACEGENRYSWFSYGWTLAIKMKLVLGFIDYSCCPRWLMNWIYTSTHTSCMWSRRGEMLSLPAVTYFPTFMSLAISVRCPVSPQSSPTPVRLWGLAPASLVPTSRSSPWGGNDTAKVCVLSSCILLGHYVTSRAACRVSCLVVIFPYPYLLIVPQNIPYLPTSHFAEILVSDLGHSPYTWPVWTWLVVTQYSGWLLPSSCLAVLRTVYVWSQWPVAVTVPTWQWVFIPACFSSPHCTSWTQRSWAPWEPSATSVSLLL